MIQYMLDTDVCIYVMQDRPPRLRQRFARLAEQLSISSIVLAELCYGAEKSARRLENLESIEQFTAHLAILPFSAKAAADYGQLRVELERLGRPAGPHDMLIAAHARSEGLVLVTNNLREFRRVPGLRVETWK